MTVTVNELYSGRVSEALVGLGTGARSTVKSVTFTGGAGLGAVGNVAVATVAGRVLIEDVIPYCVTSLGVDAGAGVASVSFGVTDDTDFFVAATQADTIDAGEFWTSGTPTADRVAVPSGLQGVATTKNLVMEVTTTDAQIVTSGEVEFCIRWRPLSSGASVS